MRLYSKHLCVVILALVLPACGNAPSSPATSNPTAPPTQSPSSAPSSVPVVLPTPYSVDNLEDRLLAAISVKFPDELVYLRGFVWVKTDDGHVIRIDPATNSVVGDVRVDTTTDPWHYCQGLGTDGESIWACSASGNGDHTTIDVVRLDPTSMTVAATVRIGKVFDQFAMPFLLDRIWVLTDNGTKLVGIDTSGDLPGPAIDLGARCFQVAAAGDTLLATCKPDDLILRVDPEAMEVTERHTIPAPSSIAATRDGVWVSHTNAVVRLNPQTLAPVLVFDGLGGVDLYATEGSVWVRLDSGLLYRIDTANNALVEQVMSDEMSYSMGGLIVTADSIWTSAGEDNLVLRIGLR